MNLQGKLFVILLIVGVAVGTEEGVATSATAERGCPSEITTNVEKPIHLKLIDIVKSCFFELNVDTETFRRENVTTEEVQTNCDKICRRQSDFQRILVEKAADLEMCPSPNVVKLFNIVSDISVNIFKSGCADGAKRFFTLMTWMYDHERTSPLTKPFRKCALKMLSVIRPLYTSHVDLSSKMFIFYKEIVQFGECNNLANNDQPSKEVFEHFVNVVVTTTMKCIHPQDGTLVPCASISVDQLSAPTICEAMTHGSKQDIHDNLENEAGRCFEIVKMDARVQDNSDNARLREEFKEICIWKEYTLKCLNSQRIISDICQNETQRNELRLLVDSIEKGFDAACLEDGKRLADVMIEVYRLKRTGHGHAVWDCIDSAKATRNELDEHHTSSSKNMRFYHELETFKGCLVNKLGDDVTSVAAATSLIGETLKVIECVNVTDGTTVTCESLMHHHH